jgi:uncharacterized membrane protein
MAAAMLVAVPVGLLLALSHSTGPSTADARPAIVLAAVSGLVEAAYFVLLSRAYRHGDLSVVYPTARGTAPLVAVAIGVLVLGERLTPLGAVGVASLLLGIVLLQRPWRLFVAGGLEPAARTASIAALATGVMVALYSAIDRLGVRAVEPAVYAALLWPAMVGWLGVAVLVSRGAASTRAATAIDLPRAVVGGLLTYAAYLLVLVALSVAPLTAVTPLRESAVVLAAAWGAIRLGEAMDRGDVARRVVAAGLVVAGIVLLVLEGS